MPWDDRYDFTEVTSPVRLRQLVECRLRMGGDYGVDLVRFNEDEGDGALSVTDKGGNVTMIPFHLPESEERFYRLCRDLLESDSQWNSPHMAERHGRHSAEIGR